MQAVYASVLRTYNPLEIKDILLKGASRKATSHKKKKDIFAFYAEHNEGLHHELLDSKHQYFNEYMFIQWAYNQTDKTDKDQYHFIRDVVWLYIDSVADELGDEYDLKNKDRKSIEDEVLAIELQHRKAQLQIIDGGKSNAI